MVNLPPLPQAAASKNTYGMLHAYNFIYDTNEDDVRNPVCD